MGCQVVPGTVQEGGDADRTEQIEYRADGIDRLDRLAIELIEAHLDVWVVGERKVKTTLLVGAQSIGKEFRRIKVVCGLQLPEAVASNNNKPARKRDRAVP